MIDIYDLEKVLVSKISFKNLIDLRTKKYLMDINYPSLYVFWFNNYDGAIKNLKRNFVIKKPGKFENNLC